jgi:hypothetical protein
VLIVQRDHCQPAYLGGWHRRGRAAPAAKLLRLRLLQTPGHQGALQQSHVRVMEARCARGWLLEVEGRVAGLHVGCWPLPLRMAAGSRRSAFSATGHHP